jgi:hypothetical protein
MILWTCLFLWRVHSSLPRLSDILWCGSTVFGLPCHPWMDFNCFHLWQLYIAPLPALENKFSLNMHPVLLSRNLLMCHSPGIARVCNSPREKCPLGPILSGPGHISLGSHPLHTAPHVSPPGWTLFFLGPWAQWDGIQMGRSRPTGKRVWPRELESSWD